MNEFMVFLSQKSPNLEEEACACTIEGKVIESDVENEKRMRRHKISYFAGRFFLINDERTNTKGEKIVWEIDRA